MNENIKLIKKFDNRLIIDYGCLIGQGSYGAVYRAYNYQNLNQQLCAKIISLDRFKENQSAIKYVKCEIESLRTLQKYDLKGVVQLIDLFLSSTQIVLFLEYCNGGSFQDMLMKRKTLSEAEVIMFAKQIATTCEFMNSELKLIHRDLKPANILIQNQMIFKIADFGFSRFLENMDQDTKISSVGSPLYMAPELLLNRPTKEGKCDVWSLGVILYQMLYGICPFYTNDLDDLKKKIENDKLIFPDEHQPDQFPSRSKKIKNLISQMLEKECEKRISWKELVKCEIFKFNDMQLFWNEQLVQELSTCISSSVMDHMYGSSLTTNQGYNVNQSKGNNWQMEMESQENFNNNSQKNQEFQGQIQDTHQMKSKQGDDDCVMDEGIENFEITSNDIIKMKKN